MGLSRRDFLKAAGVAAAGTSMPVWLPGSSDPALAGAPAMTTLRRTLVRGTAVNSGTARSYHRVVEAAGERHLVRMDLIGSGGAGLRRFGDRSRRSLLNFAHMTDVRVTDAQSPARVEFLQRLASDADSPFASTYRPQEIASVQVLDSMVRQVRGIRASPVSGKPILFAVFTGDQVENDQLNELRWFVDAVDGNMVAPNSGAGDYEGVMSSTWGDPAYWHPGRGADDYKQLYGFPDYPKLIERATAAFGARGLGIPWFQTVGNRDGLVQGRVPTNPLFDATAMGGAKLRGVPADVDPLNGFSPIALHARALLGEGSRSPAAFAGAPAQQVTADRQRHILTRKEYVAEMFRTTGTPVGHGFTRANLEQADGSVTCYWHSDDYAHFRLIGLDTVNPGGGDAGSIGAKQLAWLEQRLSEVSSRYYDASGSPVSSGNGDRYVLLLSHHGPGSLDNRDGAELDPLQADINDLPRHLSDDVVALVQRFPNVIAWISGHDGKNSVTPRRDPAGRSNGFWDIATGGNSDWSNQARLIDVLENKNGSLSIFCTMVDHAGPAVPGGRDPVLRVAAIARELAANDPATGFDGPGRGRLEDRNVELVIRAPFRLRTRAPAPEQTGVPRA